MKVTLQLSHPQASALLSRIETAFVMHAPGPHPRGLRLAREALLAPPHCDSHDVALLSPIYGQLLGQLPPKVCLARAAAGQDDSQQIRWGRNHRRSISALAKTLTR